MNWQAVGTVLLLMAAVATADIDKGGGGIVFSPDFAFKLTAPPRWLFDNDPGHNPKGYDIIYPTGSTWQSSSVVMYGVGVKKTTALQTVLDGDLQLFRRDHGATSTTARQPSLMTGDHRAAVVQRLSGTDHAVSLVAYIDIPRAWGIIRQDAHGPQFTDAQAFMFVVNSFAVVKNFQPPETIEIGPVK